MNGSTVVAYTGDTFFPPTDSKYTHEGREYSVELMHMEIRNGMVKSHMRASNAQEIRYFEFRYILPTSEPAEDNVRHLHPLKQAHA